MAAALLLLTACSALPEKRVPPHADWSFHADYTVDGSGRLQLPSTSRDVIVRHVECNPEPIAERFVDGERWFLYPAHTAVSVHGSVRVYARADGGERSLAEILPGAQLRASTRLP